MEDDFFEKLMLVNCKYHYKISKNGKCYCSSCVMSQTEETKELVKQNGCKVFQGIKNES